MTLTAFLERYPEFSEGRAPTELIQRCLAEASRAVSGSFWGSQLEDAIGLKAAHLLAISPWGQQARLADGSMSTYGEEFKERQKSIIPRAFVSRF